MVVKVQKPRGTFFDDDINLYPSLMTA